MTTKLVSLPETQKLSSRVIRVLGGNPGKFTLQGTNTYIVGTGIQRILIDTGEGQPSWIKAIRDILRTENAQCQVIITHKHVDHVGGIDHLLELYPKTKIYKYDPGEDQHEVKDNQVFKVEGATIRAVYTPGHTSDHIALILEEEDAMFTGDNVLGHGTAVFEDLAIYLKSLEKMRGMFLGRAYPGHGPVIDNGNERIAEYIRHRKLREEQILEVLGSPRSLATSSNENSLGEWEPIEIVKIVYMDVAENLHAAAHGGVMQILWKLQQEDKVVMNTSTKRWRINNRAAL